MRDLETEVLEDICHQVPGTVSAWYLGLCLVPGTWGCVWYLVLRAVSGTWYLGLYLPPGTLFLQVLDLYSQPTTEARLAPASPPPPPPPPPPPAPPPPPLANTTHSPNYGFTHS